MRYSRSEIEGARRIKALGFVWRPRIGDWYVTDDGFVGLVKGEGDALHAAARFTFLPDWATCRQWLKEHGFSHPEFARDEPEETRIEVMSDNAEIIVGTGASDLECLYAIMAAVLVRRGE